MKTLFTYLIAFLFFACNGGNQSVTEQVKHEMEDIEYPAGSFTYAAFQDTVDWKVWVNEAYPLSDADAMALKMNLLDKRIKVYAGTWCGDTKEVMPNFFHIMTTIGYDVHSIDYILLNTDRASWIDYAGADSIKKIPTILVYDNGVEIGRIIEQPLVSVEKDLIEIVVSN